MANLPDFYRGVDDENAPRGGYAGFQLTGKSPELWSRLRDKFLARVEQLVELVQRDDPTASWLRQQAKELRDGLLDNVKEKLRKEGLQSERIEAEVAKLYAEAEKGRAEARKVNAEARSVEVSTAL